jgi:DNA-binding protein H-NS
MEDAIDGRTFATVRYDVCSIYWRISFANRHTMAVKTTLNQTLTDQERLERLTQLCEELQAAVDKAGDHRRLLEQVKQTAQELLTDQEAQPERSKTSRKRIGR